jgi:hypothetical protein
VPVRAPLRVDHDDGAPWPGKVHLVFADEAGQEHRVTIAPDATGADLGQALRQVIARELALYPVTWAEALGGWSCIDDDPNSVQRARIRALALAS